MSRTCLPVLFLMLCAGPRLCVGGDDDIQPFFRTDQRVLWTTSRIQGTPDPPDPYRLEVVFPKLKFSSPVDLVTIPGTYRMAVVELNKGVSTFASSTDVNRAEILVDLSSEPGIQVFAAAFHPDFAKNGLTFFTYANAEGVHLARIQCLTASGIPRADPASRKIIYSWPTGGHTGGCIRFGPDGYLYLATGDGSGHSDTNQYSQDINDPRGAILRLDVDHAQGERLYRVPPDNPFVDRQDSVAEIYAYGLRQPWKFSFDQLGRLWAGEVGQDLWEMVYLIQKGGNYGWSINEGSHAFRPERKQGPTAIVPPVVEHDHNQFRSITGGHVYDNPRLAELQGAYIYGDFDTGRIWMLRHDEGQVSDHRQLTVSQIRPVAFGQDHQGDVYAVGYASGKLYRLVRSPQAKQDQVEFPRKLSETGLFASTPKHTPAAGLVPYGVNAPMYVDGALVQRYLALPNDTQIEVDAVVYPRGAPGAVPGWRFPDGTVLVQTFSLPLEADSGRSLLRLETRILHHEKMPGQDDEYGAQVWHGYTYIWNDDQSDAVLAAADGMDRTFTVLDSAGGTRQHTWHFPSRAECIVCHNMAGKYALGMKTWQLNREHDYGDVTKNQLAVFDRLGLFREPLGKEPDQLPRLVSYADPNESLDGRARSYLHANCAHCHRQWGGGNADIELLATLSLAETKVNDTAPAHGSFGISQAKLIAPADPYRSVLFYRMANIGPGRMPRLGTSMVDQDGLSLIHDWIKSVPSSATGAGVSYSLPTELQSERATETSASIMDQWLSSTSQALRLVRALDKHEITEPMRGELIARGAASAQPDTRDLFERYLPEEERTKRLGNNVSPDSILAIRGNARDGEELFFQGAGVQCSSCHQIRGKGTFLGPDLSEIGKKYDRYRLLDSIVNPSREIEPKYVVHLVQTSGGQVLSGLRVEHTNEKIVLKSADNKEIHVAADEVEQMLPQKQSMMPESLVRNMTAQQLADLIEYLSHLKGDTTSSDSN